MNSSPHHLHDEACPFSGDGYIHCDQGHVHWGKYGAAGLLVFNVDAGGVIRYLLQKRSAEVQYGGTWSTLSTVLAVKPVKNWGKKC